jgi:hypothetical protein
MAPEPKYPEDGVLDEESLLLATGGKEEQDKIAKKRRRTTDYYLSFGEEEEDSEDEIIIEERPDKPCCGCLGLWDTYYAALQGRPLLVKSITAFFLMGVADGMAQFVEHLRGVSHVHFLDLLRMLRFATFGLVGAPWTHFYYDWLDRVLPPTSYPWTWTTLSKSSTRKLLKL